MLRFNMKNFLIVFLFLILIVSCSGNSTITFQDQTYSLYSDEKKYADRILLGLENLVANVKICNKDKGGSLVLGGLSTRQSSLRGYPTFFATCSGETVYFDEDSYYGWEDRYK